MNHIPIIMFRNRVVQGYKALRPMEDIHVIGYESEFCIEDTLSTQHHTRRNNIHAYTEKANVVASIQADDTIQTRIETVNLSL